MSNRVRLDGTMLRQSLGFEPLTLTGQAYLDAATISDLEAASSAGSATLTGPDSTSYANMFLDKIGPAEMLINETGVRLVSLTFTGTG